MANPSSAAGPSFGPLPAAPSLAPVAASAPAPAPAPALALPIPPPDAWSDFDMGFYLSVMLKHASTPEDKEAFMSAHEKRMDRGDAQYQARMRLIAHSYRRNLLQERRVRAAKLALQKSLIRTAGIETSRLVIQRQLAKCQMRLVAHEAKRTVLAKDAAQAKAIAGSIVRVLDFIASLGELVASYKVSHPADSILCDDASAGLQSFAVEIGNQAAEHYHFAKNGDAEQIWSDLRKRLGSRLALNDAETAIDTFQRVAGIDPAWPTLQELSARARGEGSDSDLPVPGFNTTAPPSIDA